MVIARNVTELYFIDINKNASRKLQNMKRPIFNKTLNDYEFNIKSELGTKKYLKNK